MTAVAAPRFLGSTIGKKVVMAVTGVILFGFVIGHMLGNAQLYLGPAKLNSYAAFLKHTKSLLWGTRVILLISVIAHIVVAVQLAARSSAARPVKYKTARRWREGSYASRTMMISGPLLFLFIVYHLMHFTLGYAHPSYPHFHGEDVYGNVITGFQNVPASCVYIVAMLALGLHLQHGANSMFQSVGLRTKQTATALSIGSRAVVWAVVLINISMPISVMAGVVK